MSYKINHRQHDGTLIETLYPENLKFTFNKKGVHTIQYERSHAAYAPATDIHDFVGAYRTDFELIWHDDVGVLGDNVLMAGMHVDAPDTKREDDYTTIYGKDWEHYLERRQFPFNPKNVGQYIFPGAPFAFAGQWYDTDVVVILKGMLDKVFAEPYSLPITYPTLTAALGIFINWELSLGDTTDMLTFIDQFSNMSPGFDYEVLPTKEFRIYSPRKYDPVAVTTGSIPDMEAACQYVFDSSNTDLYTDGPSFANTGPICTRFLGTAAGIAQAQLATLLTYEPSEAVFRRLDGGNEYGTILNMATLQQLARTDFNFALNPQHEITFKVLAESIDQFWLKFMTGYPIWLDAELYSHRIQSAQEIIRMDCTVSNEGECEVQFGLNEIYPNTIRDFTEYSSAPSAGGISGPGSPAAPTVTISGEPYVGDTFTATFEN